MDYIRKTGKPAFIEAHLSRLYGHSSASGANFITQELDCLKEFEIRLLKADMIKEQQVKDMWAEFEKEGFEAQQKVRTEAVPKSDSIWDHTFSNNENADWRKF